MSGAPNDMSDLKKTAQVRWSDVKNVTWILGQSRSVHKVEEVAVVGAKVQDRKSLGNAVGLQSMYAI